MTTLARTEEAAPAHKPWDRRPEEPEADYARFRTYLRLGTGRSLSQAAAPCGMSLARLKQLSTKGNWPFRAAAWDQEQFLIRRRMEWEAHQETRERVLKESADWQRIARLEFGSWVCRGEDGQLQLVRELTPAEAIQLWQIGSLAVLELDGIQAASSPPVESQEQVVQRARKRFSEAARDIAQCLSYGADYRLRQDLENAVRQVLLAWITHYQAHHPDPDSLSITHSIWPWDLPFSEA